MRQFFFSFWYVPTKFFSNVEGTYNAVLEPYPAVRPKVLGPLQYQFEALQDKFQQSNLSHSVIVVRKKDHASETAIKVIPALP